MRRPTCASAGPLLLAAALVCALLRPVPAAAQSGKGEYLGAWSAAASLGYAVPDTDEFDNAFTWRVALGYSPMPRFEIDLELGRFASGVSQPDPDGIPSHTLASGRLEMRPVCLTAQYRTPLPELLSTLNLLAGIGYYFLDYEMGEEQRGVFLAGGAPGLPDQEVDDAWGFHLGAGLEYAVTERVSLLAEGRYLFLEPAARGTAAAGRRFDGSLDLNTWLFTGGIKVGF
ncbi:MAG TPA: OmpW family outer membrane protein [Candidatus Methanoperedens sp.]|nr:OmpW family outer membrane protein [Candidatus Methanoperedens sp.]